MDEKLMQWAETRWAVVGLDFDRAEQLMSEIEESCGKVIYRKNRSRFCLVTEFTDGTVLKWIQATESGRGNRIGRMWCDKNISHDILNCVILPIYFGKKKDIIWV